MKQYIVICIVIFFTRWILSSVLSPYPMSKKKKPVTILTREEVEHATELHEEQMLTPEELEEQMDGGELIEENIRVIIDKQGHCILRL